MKCAADFRENARDALSGRWPVAVLTGFIASLMGANLINLGYLNTNRHTELVSDLVRTLKLTDQWIPIRSILLVAAVFYGGWIVVTMVIGGMGSLGYAIFNLNLVDKKYVDLSDLFSQMHRFKAGLCMKFLTALYTFLWALLFIIPAFIKSYSYAMTPYILAENPEMTANEAITESCRIMDGNKSRLFWMSASFIGWRTLCSAPLLIVLEVLSRMVIGTQDFVVLTWIIPCFILTLVGSLFLHPYEEAAYAAFYREIAKTEQSELVEVIE